MSRRNIVTMILMAFLVSFLISTGMAKEYWKGTTKTESEGSQSGLPRTMRGWLGVYLQDITAGLKESMDLRSKEGVLVRDVVEDSPAERAGVEQKDVIIEFDGKEVTDASEFTDMVRGTSPRQKAELKIIRDGKEKTLTVTLGKSPEKELSIEREFESPRAKEQRTNPETHFFRFFSGSRIGVKVQDLTEQLGIYFGVEDGEGALITEVEEDMPAYQAGLKAGDVIVEVDGKKIKGTEDVMDAISEKEKGDKAEIKVIRNRRPQDFTVEVKEGERETSFDFSGLDQLKILPKSPLPPETNWMEESSSDLKQEMQELREELQDLKDQLNDLREKIR
jgi:S1-C subfamily serine protease